MAYTKAQNLLSQSIHKYYECQSVYIPGLTSTNYGEDHERLESEPEVLKLWLPSQLPSEHCTTWCLPGIPYLEFASNMPKLMISLPTSTTTSNSCNSHGTRMLNTSSQLLQLLAHKAFLMGFMESSTALQVNTSTPGKLCWLWIHKRSLPPPGNRSFWR